MAERLAARPRFRLMGPLQIYGYRKVATHDEYSREHAAFVRTNKGHDPWAQEGTLVAFVSDGRWVADCAWCGAGIAVDPDWPDDGRCWGCGAVYGQVTFPAERSGIESALELRAPRNQHWKPGESVEDLRAENAAHGLPRGDE